MEMNCKTADAGRMTVDSAKVGKLIAQLRKEQKLTQREVAEQLHVSPKTVSKWECGQGCPELSLWGPLSALLGADVPKLMGGELTPNRPDAGKLSRIRFYVCPVCGNLLAGTGPAALSCCGRLLEPLAAREAEEEHQASVEEMDGEYYVTFSHGMRKDHYLVFAAYVCDDKYYLVRLYPEQEAAFRLPVIRGRGKLYVYCNRHGLFSMPFRRP